MSNLYGSAILTVAGESREVAVALSLKEGILQVRMPADGAAIEHLLAIWGCDDEQLELTDVVIVTPNGRLSAKRLDELFLKSCSCNSPRTPRAPLSCTLQWARDSVDTCILELVPKSTLVFEHSPRVGHWNEMLLTSVLPPEIAPFDGSVGGLTYSVSVSKDVLSFQSAFPIARLRHRIITAVSVLQGAPAGLIASYEPGTLCIDGPRPQRYQRSHALYASPRDVAALFRCLLDYAINLSENDFRHWRKATTFFNEGKSSYAVLDVRVTNLFVFLEMYDGSNTLSANTLERMLKVSRNDAKLLTKVRNKLIHDRHTLEEAVHSALRELRKPSPVCEGTTDLGLRCFRSLEAASQKGVHFWATLCELINCFVARQVRWTGARRSYS